MRDLWSITAAGPWKTAHEAYDAVVKAQRVKALPELDRWYRDELRAAILGRRDPFVTGAELLRVTEWKMARGVWRARNLALVRGNEGTLVERTSRDALAAIPDPRKPIAILATLAGVGPATASAVAAAADPATYPFFDELVAAQVPGLGPVAFTPAYYARYADALRERARELGDDWTPGMVERALWANAGGKAGVRPDALSG